jgi:hypothetical protein
MAFTPKFRRNRSLNNPERGVTMALVAIALVAIIAMAALSIDVVTLFLAREEAQRAADAGALAAARIMSLGGLTGDTTTAPTTWECICGAACPVGNGTEPGFATLAAERASGQSTVSGLGDNSSPAFSVNVTYSANGASSTDCTTFLGATASAFGVNPMVTVQVTRSSLPTFFSRIWGNTGNTAVASANAEAFNPSFSESYGNNGAGTGTIIPVQPRCVKPWIVPNWDPLNPGDTCTGNTGNLCTNLVDPANGSIEHTGVSLDGSGATGVIGEQFTLIPDCAHGTRGSCSLFAGNGSGANPQPQANVTLRLNRHNPGPPNLEYVPAQAANASVAVPSAASAGDLYEQAIAGCDQTPAAYQCGVPSANTVDLSEDPLHPYGGGDTTNGVMALIHQIDPYNTTQSSGQDYFTPTYGIFTSTPFQVLPGSANPLINIVPSGTAISASNSIVTVPIYDTANNIANNGSTSTVTIVGFLQVFINGVDAYGDVNVTVLNVAGCSNGSGGNVGSAVTGSSPVPIRLITPPSP